MTIFNTKEAADYIGVHTSTLCRWRYDDTLKEGISKPKSIKIGGRVFYKKTDLDTFLGETVKAGVAA